MHDHLQKVISTITHLIQPEKIYLLGLSSPVHAAQNIFVHPHSLDTSLPGASHFDLLIITRKNDKRPFYELHEFIEKRCKGAVSISIFIEQIHVFDEWLTVGHAFARRVFDSGIIIFDAGTPWSKPKEINYAAEVAEVQKDFKFSNENITEFIAGAELFKIRRQFGLAAFMLHQAAETAYTIFVKAITGYRLTTHNLCRMIRFASPFSSEIAALFPRNSESEIKLFQQFQNSYIEARYREDFMMTEDQITILNERVRKLQLIVRKTIARLHYEFEEPPKEPVQVTGCQKHIEQKQ